MKIYTREGDTGKTGLFGGDRVSKHHIRIDAYGTIDELNAALGVVIASTGHEQIKSLLIPIQNRLFTVGADLATPTGNKHEDKVQRTPESYITDLEVEIDRLDEQLPEMKYFILPGGSHAAAQLHLARTICRRAERICTALADHETINEMTQSFINRLSDFLFMLARYENLLSGVKDVKWTQNSNS